MKKPCLILMIIGLFFSCGQRSGDAEVVTNKDVKKSTVVCTDTSKLSRLIDLSKFKPIGTKFKYTNFDNSGQNQRLSVPGPSDYNLQCVLYFDSVTFKSLKRFYENVGQTSNNVEFTSFQFDWLSKDIRDELIKSDTNTLSYPNSLFGNSVKVWLLDNKLLLTKSAN